MMLEKIAEILSKYTKEEITAESTLVNDLGLSSFDIVSIVTAFEDEFDIEIREFSGTMEIEKAVQEIRRQIDNGIVIPYLLLKHKNSNFKFLIWHWFLIVGYEEIDKDFYVKVATYGKFHWLSFQELWATGYNKKGGMIILDDKLTKTANGNMKV